MKKALLAFTCLLVFIVRFSYGQDEANTRCIQNLSLAEDRYDAGILQGIRGLLDNCLKNDNFSKEETIRAYRLLTLVHIFNDNEQAAEESMINLIKADPEHPIDPILDPQEFIFLYQKFRTAPIFRVGFKLMGNLSEANVIDSYHTNNQLGDANKTYSQEFALGGELSVEREFFDYFEGVGSVGYTQRSFSFQQIAFGVPTPLDQAQSGTDAALVTENQTWIDANLAVRAFYKFPSFAPYVFVGGGFNYLLSTSEDAVRGAVTSDAVDLVKTGNRKQLNYSIFGGIGLKYRIGVNFLVLEGRYVNGLTNLVETRTRYPIQPSYEPNGGDATSENLQRQNRLFSTGVVDDNFGVNSIMFSVGFIKSFYKPVKLKDFR